MAIFQQLWDYKINQRNYFKIKIALLVIIIMILVSSFNVFHSTLLFNLLIANPTKWSNTLKQSIGKLLTNCLSVFDHFVKLTLRGLTFPVFFSLVNPSLSLFLPLNARLFLSFWKLNLNTFNVTNVWFFLFFHCNYCLILFVFYVHAFFFDVDFSKTSSIFNVFCFPCKLSLFWKR